MHVIFLTFWMIFMLCFNYVNLLKCMYMYTVPVEITKQLISGKNTEFESVVETDYHLQSGEKIKRGSHRMKAINYS